RKEAQATRRSGGSRPASRPGGKPNDPKSARKAMAMQRREKAAEYRKAMNSGDLSKLPARERVPERVMARDIVDERRNLGPLLLGVIVVAYIIGLAPVSGLKVVAFYLLPLCLIGIVTDSVIAARRVSRAVHEKYPNSIVKIKGYVGQRALMPARWRQPRPRPNIVVGRWIPRR
ncbi:MAG TPA: DUF3043 domain-containing protein, partial [Frankiaceae bacterium]|nr:DUF3043 domain-containing protein [Frankiaceae bacterium]